MAVAVLWLALGYVAPSTGPGPSPKGTSRNLSDMDFAGLVSTFLSGVALVVASVLNRPGGRQVLAEATDPCG